jgi:hypothetical protein
MCGLSASGKSYLAERLVPRLPAVRLRSDVARKARSGLRPRDSARAEVGAGLYTARTTRSVYASLARLTDNLLRSGEHVIVDATFIEPQHREPFLALATRLGFEAVVVYCEAPREVLEERLRARSASGSDPSDADLAVLNHQAEIFVPPQRRTVRVDTREPLDDTGLEELARSLIR